jgi:acyl-CoA synthetase (AMP-forming)/AMP-acid ligase II
VELAVAGCHPLIRPGCIAAFGLTGEAGEELAVVVELRAAPPDGPAGEVRGAIQTALAATFGVTAGHIMLAPRGTIRKTPSGKVRRAECRSRYLAGDLVLFDEERELDNDRTAVSGGRPRVA